MARKKWTARRLQQVETTSEQQKADSYIQAMLLRIQARWTERERRRRQHGRGSLDPFEVPEVAFFDGLKDIPRGGVHGLL